MTNVQASAGLQLTKSEQKVLATLQQHSPNSVQGYLEAMTAAKVKPVKEIKPIIVTYGEFKGHKTLSMLRGESSSFNKPFTIGKAKALMILEKLDYIKDFANQE